MLEHGVQTKILTGDNEKVTQAVCEKVGLDINQMLLGSEIDQMSDQELAQAVEEVTVLPNFLLTKKQGLFYNLRLMVMRSAIWEMESMMPLL